MQLARLKLARWYVLGVRSTRHAFLFSLVVLAVCILLLSGFLLFHIGLYFYLPWSARNRALLLVILGAFYFASGVAIIVRVSSEAFWMRMTGAGEAVARAVRGEPLCGEDGNLPER